MRLVLADGGRLAFKRFREGHPRSAEREAAALRLLGGRDDLSVPRLVAEGDGFVLVTMLPGRILREIVEDLELAELESVYRQVGAFQRALHETRPAGFGELAPRAGETQRSGEEAMGVLLDEALRRFYDSGGSRRLGTRCVSFFNAHAEALALCAEPSLCHVDCHEGNMLVVRRPGGELELCGVFDFDCARAADPMLDVAETYVLSRRSGPRMLAALCEGYGDLPAGWRERFDVARVVRLLVLRNWYVKNVSRAGEVHTERHIRRLVGDPGLAGLARRVISPRRD